MAALRGSGWSQLEEEVYQSLLRDEESPGLMLGKRRVRVSRLC